MIKLRTIGMIDKNLKNDPTVKAHADILNGYLCTVAGGKTVAPVAGASSAKQSKDLRIVMNAPLGDDSYTDIVIKKDSFANTFILKEWEGQDLVFDESHITYASEKSYKDLTVGTKLVADTNGKFAVSTDVSNYGVYFEIVQKIAFNGNGIIARIAVSEDVQAQVGG